jgi:cytochrome oxidase Cu insertion factor (SCO1/SenC/PrrC family)
MRNSSWLIAILSLLLIVSVTAEARGQNSKVRKYKPWTGVPDVVLVNEDGEKVKFADLVKNRMVAINFIFTNCKYKCPMQAKKFSDLQTALGEKLGKDVQLISISRDPKNDTPENLKSWAKDNGAKPGWTLLTGEKAEIDRLMMALIGSPSTGRQDHNSVILIGKGNENGWAKLTSIYGLAPTREIINLIEDVK